jgi:hypothetical protein
MLLANSDMAHTKPQQNRRIIALVQWMGLIFLSGFMRLNRGLRTNRKRKTYVFLNNRVEGNPLEAMKVILTSAECSDAAHPLPAEVLDQKSAHQLPLR